jgi:hypothetical protein
LERSPVEVPSWSMRGTFALLALLKPWRLCSSDNGLGGASPFTVAYLLFMLKTYEYYTQSISPLHSQVCSPFQTRKEYIFRLQPIPDCRVWSWQLWTVFEVRWTEGILDLSICVFGVLSHLLRVWTN